MKTDKFNEILRQKLLGIEPPPYHEADWERMSKFMDSKHPPSFWQHYGQAILYSSGLAIISGLLILNLTQLNENKRLLTEIKEIRNQKLAGTATSKKDTVFVVQYRSQPVVAERHIATRTESPRAYKGSDMVADLGVPAVVLANEDNETAKVQNIDNVQRSKQTDNIVAKGPDFKEQKNDKQQNIKSKSAEIQTISGDKQALYSKSIPKQNDNQNSKNSKNVVNVQGDLQANTQNFETDNNSIIASNESNSLTTIEPLQPTELTDLQTDLADEVKNKKLKVKTLDDMTWPSESKKTKPVRLAAQPLRVQLGMSGVVGNRMMGTGLSAEILIGKRWSLNVGLEAVRIGGEQFLSDDLFNEKHKQDFRNLYAPPQKVPASADILNIKSSLRLVRLPVFVSYRYPLRRDFTLLFSAGSAFDLSVKENISFNFRPSRQDFATETRNQTKDFVAFNNVFGGMGIEKRWGHFVIQAQPYLGFKIAQMPLPNHEDREGHPQMGFRLRALYRLGQ